MNSLPDDAISYARQLPIDVHIAGCPSRIINRKKYDATSDSPGTTLPDLD
jgi:hypothetical protein